jgi:Beta-galactosidase
VTLPVTGKIPFGGDYNPEQWPEDVWAEDHRLFDAARIDTVTLGVFTWALVQPAPGVYDLAVLDRIVERAVERAGPSAWRPARGDRAGRAGRLVGREPRAGRAGPGRARPARSRPGDGPPA